MKLTQVHLRDLFWLVLVVAMGCAWWLEQSKLAEQKRVAQHWRDHAMTLGKALQTEDHTVMLRDEHGNEVNLPPIPFGS